MVRSCRSPAWVSPRSGRGLTVLLGYHTFRARLDRDPQVDPAHLTGPRKGVQPRRPVSIPVVRPRVPLTASWPTGSHCPLLPEVAVVASSTAYGSRQQDPIHRPAGENQQKCPPVTKALLRARPLDCDVDTACLDAPTSTCRWAQQNAPSSSVNGAYRGTRMVVRQ